MFDSELIPQLSDREIEALTVAEFAAWDDVASDRQMIPDGLDEWGPGPFLAAVLSSIDPSRLDGHDTVVLMKAHARQVAHDQGGYYISIGEMATTVPTGENGPPERTEEWFEYASMEVRAALTLTRRAADSELDFAYDLIERLPSLLEALDSGAVDLRKARAIARGTGHLDQKTARDVADRVLQVAARLTIGQLRARLQRLCIESNPEDARQRSKNAIDDRRLIIEPTVDGTADFRGYGAAIDRGAAIGRKINGLARNLKTADEPRTMDQLRMDVFLDLLEGGYSGSARPARGTVDLHVDLETLAGLSEAPGDWPGTGRRSPTSHVRWPEPNQIPNGGPPSPTNTATSSTPGPPVDDPPPARNVRSTPSTPPVSSSDVACRHPNATSTTPHPGLTAEKPVSKTTHPSADTTMSAVTRRDGST